jgi:hypothetical protein
VVGLIYGVFLYWLSQRLIARIERKVTL